jgi:hypothetical protein
MNKIYLCCSAHADTHNAFLLGERRQHGYTRQLSITSLNKWFEAHEGCCAGYPDHYQLAHQITPNSDQIPELKPVDHAVKLELVR